MLIRRCIMLLISIIILSLICTQALGEKRSRYRFNHPPSIDSEDTAPVVVTFNKGEARENKAIKLTANFKSSPTENNKINEKEIPSQGVVPMINIISDVIQQGREKINVSEQNPMNIQVYTRTNFQIPDVYEKETSTLLSTKESELNSSINRRKFVRRRPQKLKENIDSPVAVVYNTNKTQEGSSVERKETIMSNISQPKTDSPLNEPIKDQTQNIFKGRKRIREPVATIVTEKGIKGNQTTLSNISPPKTDNPLNVPTKDQTQNISKGRKRMREPIVPIVNEKNFVFAHSGNFHYSFEGGDGTKVFEEGSLKTINNHKAGEAVFGGFSYKDKEGKDYSLTYTADENGYRPIGDHLPTPPPIPPEIARALKYLATKSTPQPGTEATRNFD